MENENSQKSEKTKSYRRKKVHHIIGATIAGVIMAVMFALVFGFLVKILWNWLMPAIFHVSEISYWQAFGIVILAKLLFGRHGVHHGHGHNHFTHKKIHRKDSPKNWKYYKQFWQDEGKTAFEAYIDRIKAEQEQRE